MPKANETWTVHPHEPVVQLDEGLWSVVGALPNMPLKRVMTVARRADGQLVIHNAVPLDEPSMKTIEAAGPVGFIVVPNGWHRLDAAVFKKRYPSAKVVAPSGSRKKVEEVVPVDYTFEDFPSDSVVSMRTLSGLKEAEGIMIVKSPKGTTLVFTDGLFNMPHLPGVQGFVLKHLTQSSGGPRVSRIFRMLALKDKAAYRADLEALAATPNLKRIIVGHHETIDSDPAGTLRSVAATV